jgi:hypothetical protein
MGTRIALGLLSVGRPIVAALVIAAVALFSIHAVAPYCPPGGKCVWSAGVSVVVPSGWSTQPVDRGELLVIAPGKDARVRIVMEDGAAIGSRPHATLDVVEATMIAALGDTSDTFTHVNGLAVERVSLPVGPAVRARYVSTTTFIISYSQANDSVWFFANGRLLAVSWQQQLGEAMGSSPPIEMVSALRSLLESVRSLDT